MDQSEVAVIEARNLSHWYLRGTPLEVRSLRDVNFTLFRDETVGIVGSSGSGKSTLLQHLNGIIKPQAGEVLIDGIPVSQFPGGLREVRRRVGLVFQNPEDQLFERYAGDDVAFGPRNLGLSPVQVRERVREAMEMVSLPFSYKDRLTTELSHGERRRLALAGVFAMEPEVLLLDEPTAGIDPGGKEKLFEVFKRWRKGGRAMIVASHSMDDIAFLCNRVYVLKGGRVLREGTTAEVLSDLELLSDTGLEPPYSVRVMYELLRMGYPVKTSALTLQEAAEEILGIIYEKNI
ncbi:MAG: ATP-binding cassette domain-containing protein [Spirochaetota bacterium]